MRRALWLSLVLATLAHGQTQAPKPADSPDQVLRRYLEAWARDDAEAMYRLTTREGQRQIVFDEFAALVRGGFRSSRPFPGGGPGPGPGPNQGGGGFRREPPGEDGFRILHIYPPQLHGDWTSVSFTLQFRDGRLERNPAFLVRENEEWRFPMHFDETTRTWHLPPSAPTRVPFGGRPGFGEGRGGGGGFGAGFGGDNRINIYMYALRHLPATQALERLGRSRPGGPGREGPPSPPPASSDPVPPAKR